MKLVYDGHVCVHACLLSFSCLPALIDWRIRTLELHTVVPSIDY